MTRSHFWLLVLLLSSCSSSQFTNYKPVISDRITLENPSFESHRQCGIVPDYWMDASIGSYESPSDIQPGCYGVTTRASHGDTYVGMVVKDNGSFESIGQKLTKPLLKDSCYTFKINLCHSADLASGTYKDPEKIIKYDQGVVLRIIGRQMNYAKKVTLAESPVITHTDWRIYNFDFKAPMDGIGYFILEANFSDTLKPSYNGNILLDHASDILMVPCE